MLAGARHQRAALRTRYWESTSMIAISVGAKRYHRDFWLRMFTTSSHSVRLLRFHPGEHFLHHIDPRECPAGAFRASEFLTADVHLHSVELVSPKNAGIPRWLALHGPRETPELFRHARDIYKQTGNSDL